MLCFMTAIGFYDFIDFFIFSSFENNQFYILHVYYSLLPMTVHCGRYRCEVLFNIFILFAF